MGRYIRAIFYYNRWVDIFEQTSVMTHSRERERERERDMGRDGHGPLFETKEATGRIAYKMYAISIFVGVFFVWVYRATHIPVEKGKWAWFGMFGVEIWFGLYWILIQSVRWKPVYRSTFKERLSQRYENELPGVDIFVCTADPAIEPPTLVINTVLSVMAYDYPPEKLSVYLSDDAGCDITFYALLEASRFSTHWIPFCKKFIIEPRSPEGYFSSTCGPSDTHHAKEWSVVKTLYEEMKNRVETAMKLGKIPEEIKTDYKGFSEWNSYISSRDHPTFLQIRVSSEMSNGSIVLNVDCDMYANNSNVVRDAMCFFMDVEKGHEIGFVQFPQYFNNITKNDIYASALRVINEVEGAGLDGYGGPPYLGTGCFHRRESLCGRKYGEEYKGEWKKRIERKVETNAGDLEEKARAVASCTYEENTEWGKEMGLKYGCPSEDLITGLAIQCRGWKSVYCNPDRKAFLGMSPTTLEQSLVQHKRWGEGQLQIFMSRYCPLIYGHGKIKLGLQMGYCNYNLWALNSFPTLYYVIIPSLCLAKGISLFPRISSPWSAPFTYVFIAKYGYSLCDSIWFGDTIKGWWNMQRMWILRRTSSYIISTIDTTRKLLGLTESAFVVTAKVADKEVLRRYDKEIMEFGSTSPMFTILATHAMVNLICLVGAIKRLAMDTEIRDVEPLILQLFLCGLLVMINMPIYQGLFLRKDMGRMPVSLAFTCTFFAVLACIIPMY
ncbi:cellulose synthase-like protein E6 isoform X2 [Magnolia sinica]|uniref:cellulose synthase-like protein E6 isoform X2 n=1 Tax=Magnolia sinica TaxID=86752 RepID=UPI0026591423|nr:cellulose synthase-like protein E6 isoform X2 [Magnolia sinica]